VLRPLPKDADRDVAPTPAAQPFRGCSARRDAAERGGSGSQPGPGLDDDRTDVLGHLRTDVLADLTVGADIEVHRDRVQHVQADHLDLQDVLSVEDVEVV